MQTALQTQQSGAASGEAQPGTPPSPSLTSTPDALLEAAAETFDQAVRASADEPGAGRSLFEQSAALYRAIAEQHGVENPTLQRNLGNALLLAGRTGPAVLAYRRGLALDPGDAGLRSALDAARARLDTRVEPDTSERLREAAMSWRTVLPRPGVLIAFAVAYTLAWLCVGWRVARGVWPRPPSGLPIELPVTGLAVTAAVSLGGFVVLDRWDATRDPMAVVVAVGGAPARTGPSEAIYPPAFDRALPAGAEVIVEDRKGAWAKVRVIDGREAWVRFDALEFVMPGRAKQFE